MLMQVVMNKIFPTGCQVSHQDLLHLQALVEAKFQTQPQGQDQAQRQTQQNSPNNYNNNRTKVRTRDVLPCFNLICTGTCAYGPKCTFLHDPRAQLPKSERRKAERQLQSDLHTYRPNQNSRPPSFKAGSADSSDCDSGSISSHEENHCVNITGKGLIVNSTNRCTKQQLESKKAGYKKDDTFDFPAFALPINEGNAKCYEPHEEQRLKHEREISMWFHLLAVVNVNTEDTYLGKVPMTKSRLPLFRRMSEGRSASSVVCKSGAVTF
jgi:hypothetical protein